MKKTFRLLSLALLMTLMSASFTSCGTDEPTPDPENESMTGWEIQPATETELD